MDVWNCSSENSKLTKRRRKILRLWDIRTLKSTGNTSVKKQNHYFFQVKSFRADLYRSHGKRSFGNSSKPTTARKHTSCTKNIQTVDEKLFINSGVSERLIEVWSNDPHIYDPKPKGIAIYLVSLPMCMTSKCIWYAALYRLQSEWKLEVVLSRYFGRSVSGSYSKTGRKFVCISKLRVYG